MTKWNISSKTNIKVNVGNDKLDEESCDLFLSLFDCVLAGSAVLLRT